MEIPDLCGHVKMAVDIPKSTKFYGKPFITIRDKTKLCSKFVKKSITSS